MKKRASLAPWAMLTVRTHTSPYLCACLAAACLTFAADLRARTIETTISWRSCTPELVDTSFIDALGARLECGTMPALLDANAPALGSLTVGLVRFKAGDPTQRKGAIFFNFGGPGGNPVDFLPGFGYLWSTRSLDHPLDGDKRRLTDQFDLIAVIPRGLRGGTRFACRVDETSDGHDPTVDLADWNWAGFVKDARAYAAGCAEDPLHPHVGTLQHIRDMEQVRLALREPVLNFVGFSYGTWVGAMYASAYPTHTGRVVLDSVMNYAGTFQDQVAIEPYERETLFARTALRPALAAPATFGIGSSAEDVLSRLRNMPNRAREAWASVINTPAQLVAALTLADWVRADGEGTQASLLTRMNGYRFSTDVAADGDIRSAATEFAAMIERGRADDPATPSPVDVSVYAAVVCGDTPWKNDLKSLRTLANEISARYPAANGNPVVLGLTCMHWASPPRWRPPLTELAKAPPMLMIQAQFDPATPLAGAIRAFNASPDVYMVLARGMVGHGVFGSTATPCVERAVDRFLLEGELPSRRLSGCDFVPRPPSRDARDAGDVLKEHAVREELARRLRRS